MISQEEWEEELCRRHTYQNQAKIRKARVAICGLGGLGSNIAISLVRAGIGELNLIDFDQVELSNIHRQQYQLKQIGMLKTEALAETLREINPWCKLRLNQVRLTELNLKEYLEETIICEAFDCPKEKSMLTNGVMEQLPDSILIGASGMAGFKDSNLVKTRKIASHYYLCGDGEYGIETEQTLMAPRVMICAAHQANLVLQIILGAKD